MDDGTDDDGLTRRVSKVVEPFPFPVRLITSRMNRGRSATRNALQASSTADWVLFLDADMRIDHLHFLQTYLDRSQKGDCDIVFGGFTLEPRPHDRRTQLHHALSRSSDCMSAEVRERKGAQHVASSNLCIRKSVLQAQPFDPAFEGWGWEDSEWAARVARTHRLCHVDNPAVHLGLETAETLLDRFAMSGGNYRRFVDTQPALARRFPLYRIVKRLESIPGHEIFRPALRRLVLSRATPMRARIFALKLWRASHYAEAML